MDDILAKHLTSTLLLLKNDEKNKTTVDETIIPYYSYKIIDNLFHVKTDGNTIVSKNKGYWRDKPILEYNNNKYVLLEASSNIVRIDNLGITSESITPYIMDTKHKEEQISNNLLKSIKDIITTNKPVVKQKQKPIVKNTKIVKKEITPPKPEIKDIVDTNISIDLPQEVEQELKPKIPNQEEIIKSVDEIAPKETDDNYSVISHYVNTLKSADKQTKQEDKPETSTVNYIDNGKPKSFEEEMFSLLDTKKDDPRIKRLFSHYTEQAKKEVHEINEKYSKQYLAKLLENSGGGGTSNSAVDYSKGGIIDGSLTITSNLSVVGEVYSNLVTNNKKVFYIGNTIDTEYIIDHNFNTKDLIINIYDSEDEMVLAYVKNINNNQTQIVFKVPFQNIKVIIMK
jgi:hypothetical protein